MAHQDLKDYKFYIEEACQLIKELVNIEEKEVRNFE